MMRCVGDAYHGRIQQVRSEKQLLGRIRDGVTVEQPLVLIQIVNYSRTVAVCRSGILQPRDSFTKTINTYLPDGHEEGMSVCSSDGTLISGREYELDPTNFIQQRLNISPRWLDKEKLIRGMTLETWLPSANCRSTGTTVKQP